MNKTNKWEYKNLVLIFIIIILALCMYKCNYLYKLNYKYSRYFTKEIDSSVRKSKKDIEKNFEILNNVIRNKYINKDQWNDLGYGYRTVYSNMSFLKEISEHIRIKLDEKYNFETSDRHAYTEYFTYFLTSNIRFKLEDRDTKYFLNEDELIYFNKMLNFTNKYLDILTKYNGIKKYVNEDKWLDLIYEMDKILIDDY
ncbi:hypothetical protein [Clostridiisalibacter paucivorans]|uniref:hypothetical protein n=1 Tax=Clostridiisalibacter paucivorans TaxID=408753 RepID=UPI00047BE8CF|nr:hypothetical protein [Clostridiisalibacter paucivorans]